MNLAEWAMLAGRLIFIAAAFAGSMSDTCRRKQPLVSPRRTRLGRWDQNLQQQSHHAQPHTKAAETPPKHDMASLYGHLSDASQFLPLKGNFDPCRYNTPNPVKPGSDQFGPRAPAAKTTASTSMLPAFSNTSVSGMRRPSFNGPFRPISIM